MKRISLLIAIMITLALNVKADGPTGFVTLSIKNTPPIIHSVRVINNTSDNSLECKADFFDENPDNTTINYAWQLNNSVVSCSRIFVPKETGEYRCIARITDEHGASSELSSKSFVINKDNTAFKAVTGRAVFQFGKRKPSFIAMTLLIALLSFFLIASTRFRALYIKKK